MHLKDCDEGRALVQEVIAQPGKIIFGLERVTRDLGMALITPMKKDTPLGPEYAQAHVILNDIPGRGKTALLMAISASIEAKLGRIDGRPDLMPSDFTGREEKDKFSGIRTLLKGPLHSNIFFADEMNRIPPKSQAPMLGAMEGGKIIMNVTNEKEGRIEPVGFPLFPISDDPEERRLFFMVLATMNPIEFEGTYPPSEAQMERFTYMFPMGVPTRDKEKLISADNVMGKRIRKIMDLGQLLDIQMMVSRIKLSPDALELRQRYMENSRPLSQDLRDWGKSQFKFADEELVEFVNRYVKLGCSQRRNFHMEAAAKAHAFLRGEDKIATIDDMKAIAHSTMEHVIQLEPVSIGDGITTKDVVEMIIRGTDLKDLR